MFKGRVDKKGKRLFMDAIDLALKGEKVAKATLKDVERASVEEQEKPRG